MSLNQNLNMNLNDDFAIIAKNVNKNFAEIKALVDINLEVKKGELFGLIGPDGAGKSTLIRILNSLMLADSGTIRVMGDDPNKDYKSLRNKIGYMPGKFSLYQDLTVEENINFFATIFGTSIEENYHLVKDIYSQIEPFKKRLAGKLSGGMKQKLALSCALIHKPEILFLDEPTTGVDPVSRKEFWQMLKNLKSFGITIFVSTPYMDEASLCDKVALIQNGKIMTINSPSQIEKDFPKKLYSIESNNMYLLINSLREFENCHSAYPFGDQIHYCDKRNVYDIQEIKQFLIDKGNEIQNISLIDANIEDCFMELMNND